MSPVLPEYAPHYYIYARIRLQLNHLDNAGPVNVDNVLALVDSGTNYMHLEVNDETLVQEFKTLKERMASDDPKSEFHDCDGWQLVPTLDIWPISGKTPSQEDSLSGFDFKVDLSFTFHINYRSRHCAIE